MSYLANIKSYYDRQYPGDDTAPIGATEEEVQSLEQRLGVRLPEAHREFLLWMGKDHAGILSDGHWYLRDIEELTSTLPEWLESNGQTPPAPGTFVCCYDYQGYATAWYEMPNKDEDPYIYFCMEGSEEKRKPRVRGPFSLWVLECMQSSHMSLMRQREARKQYDEEQARLKAAGSAGASTFPSAG